jgi:GT2 family glycosyltransferase
MDRYNLDFIVLVVIYNIEPLESSTIQCLINSFYEIKDSKIIIWDNSEIAPSSESIDKLRKYWGDLEYHHTPMNLPLSQIYNRIIAKIKDHGTQFADRYRYFLLFDHDSVFSSDYFITLRNAMMNFAHIMLFVPRVISNNICVSPGNLFYFKGFYTKKRLNGLTKSYHKTAINSGMAISTQYLERYYGGYNEKLTFYGIDNFFMIQYSRFQEYFFVIDYNMKHKLAQYVHEDISMKRWRHKNTIESIKAIIADFNVFVRLLGNIYIYYLKCKFIILLHFAPLYSSKR